MILVLVLQLRWKGEDTQRSAATVDQHQQIWENVLKSCISYIHTYINEPRFGIDGYSRK
jgi:hypothetical protein